MDIKTSLMNLSPIVLFVYNRPKHSLRTLTALMENDLANQSTLYIYCDGPKENSTKETLLAIENTRKVIRQAQWCKEVIIVESERNMGLAKSIVKGVTEVTDIHQKAIVLEDDIKTCSHFLKYMNEGLRLFEDRKDIGSINGYSTEFLAENRFPPFFLLNNADCWGWATWKDRWANFEFDAKKIKDRLIAENKVHLYEYGRHMSILNSQINGVIDTWDVQWHGTHILNNQKGVFARFTFIENIGQDGSGTHYNTDPGEQPVVHYKFNDYRISLTDYVANQPLLFSQRVENKFRKHYLKYFITPFHVRVIRKLKRIYEALFSRN